MPDNKKRRLIPIYTSKGDADAFLYYPYLFNRIGEWIGWVTPERDVYSILGFYVGFLTDEPRILRRRSDPSKSRLDPPPSPGKIYPSATVPLAPLMTELAFGQVDVLQDEPERLHTPDSGDLRPDMD